MLSATAVSTVEPVERARQWPETIAPHHHRLAGSYLEPDFVDDRYARFVVHTTPGLCLLGDLLAVRERIAALFAVTPTQVQLGKYPAGPSRFRLTVAAADPLAEQVPATEPYSAHGALILGPYLDGDGEAAWRLQSARGNTQSGVIIAGPDSGATSLTELIAVSARATMPTSLVYLDGYGGLSSPLLRAHANLTGDTTMATTVPDVLDRLEQVIHDRGRRLMADGRTRLTVSDTDPLVLVVLDGAAPIFDGVTVATRWNRVAKEGWRTGVALVATLGSASVADFGQNPHLRRQLCHTNLIGLRTRGVVTGPCTELAALNDLPPVSGVGLHLGAGDVPPREFRARHLDRGQAEQLLTGHPGHALPSA